MHIYIYNLLLLEGENNCSKPIGQDGGAVLQKGAQKFPTGTETTQLKETMLLNGSGASREQIVPSPNWLSFLLFCFFFHFLLVV